MAVTITGTRVHESFSAREVRAFVTYALSGTYATGGFVTPFSTVAGAPGSSPFQSKTPILFEWYSPKGYIYRSTIAFDANGLPTVTTKIFSAINTELANTTAVPDASVLVAIDMQKY